MTVTLLGSDGTTVLGTTTTNGSGAYSFTNLAPGTYYVQFTAPSGYTFTTKNATGSTTANDSNANVSTGKTDAIALVSGTPDSTIDAGLYQAPTGSIGDRVWFDANANGLQDGGAVGVAEVGVAGVTVNLLDGSGNAIPGKTTTTNANGNYLFSNLAAGNYIVQFILPANRAFTTYKVGSNDAVDSDANVTTGKTAVIALAAGQTNLNIDAGLIQHVVFACTNDLVLNPSFELNTGSPPKDWTNGTAGSINVPAVDGKNVGYISGTGIMYQNVNVTAGSSYTFTFYAGSHNPKSQTVTIQYYNSSNATIGTASVYTITSDLEVSGFGGPYTLTLGAAPSNAKYLRISVTANNYDYAKVDALCLTSTSVPAAGSIGDRVWLDTNANGLQDGGAVGVAEVGVPGVTVNLLDGSGNPIPGKTTTTNANGNYLFSNLAAGNYIVQFIAPANTAFTTYKVGSNDAIDSDANATTGKTAVIALAAGQTNLNIDAGLVQHFTCACANNLVLNPSFELNTGSPPTDWTNGTAGPINVPAVDGKNVGYISGTGIMYQNVNIKVGSSYTFTFYAGSHNPKAQTVSIQYYDASNVAIGSAAVYTITSDLEVSGFGGPYTLTLGAAPSNAKYLRISVSANGYDYAKVDALCLQAK